MTRYARLLSISVMVVVISGFIVLWALFGTMYLSGQRSLTIYANEFGEFWIEFVVFTLAVVFLPVLVYELDRGLAGSNQGGGG
ncbi:hypothetical protein HSRCO_0275 [Halanaeroarchaeum sp. HSR-CO]|uniref:hypothetical protein n=1 Tax=Halanaeroarchaeum sp. HSR-CO TaxID=2866382 RepID=UPI00217E32E1|nr:hypothetical protein [Halanaeroarchaeum sp. HSR-CO]UWG46574.1 hypothetical protein HSRCO_0275 [Halanaeroarchaeum sp. HSR-CO]